MKGIIVINPYKYPENSVRQAERLKEEFINLGVSVEIKENAFFKTILSEDKIYSSLEKVDFIVFLDKDKYLSKELTLLGERLFNKHDAIRLCDDKGETCLALINGGVKMPKTMFAPLCFIEQDQISNDYLEEIIDKLSLPVIIKESYGSMGYGVHKADTKEEFIELEKKLKLRPRIYQEYIGYKKGTDVRVIVVGKKAVCSMLRENPSDFRSNVGHGGKGRSIEPSVEFIKTAERCAEILDLDYCGVDLLIDKDGSPVVCEVNSNAFFEEIEKVSKVNVAKIYAEYIIKRVKNG